MANFNQFLQNEMQKYIDDNDIEILQLINNNDKNLIKKIENYCKEKLTIIERSEISIAQEFISKYEGV